jgi:hypothetical protein
MIINPDHEHFFSSQLTEERRYKNRLFSVRQPKNPRKGLFVVLLVEAFLRQLPLFHANNA